MSVEFLTHANGFYGTMKSEKMYEVDWFDEVERLINDCTKVLKSGVGAETTFEYFNACFTALSRISVSRSGEAECVVWMRDAYGNVYETKIEKISLVKKEIKKRVLEAIKLFRKMDSEEQAVSA